MSSSSNSDNFWTQTSGICTLVGLVIGSILAAVTLWYTLRSYRQLRTSTVLPIATTFGEPPPPYTIESNSQKDSMKSNSLSVSSTFDSSDDLLRGRVAERCERKRKGRLGRRRWFVLLLILAIILSAGVIVLAANISKIRSLSSTGTTLRAAANPGFTTTSVSRAPVSVTTASDHTTSTISITSLASSGMTATAFISSPPTPVQKSYLGQSVPYTSELSAVTSSKPSVQLLTFQSIKSGLNFTATENWPASRVSQTTALIQTELSVAGAVIMNSSGIYVASGTQTSGVVSSSLSLSINTTLIKIVTGTASSSSLSNPATASITSFASPGTPSNPVLQPLPSSQGSSALSAESTSQSSDGEVSSANSSSVSGLSKLASLKSSNPQPGENFAITPSATPVTQGQSIVEMTGSQNSSTPLTFISGSSSEATGILAAGFIQIASSFLSSSAPSSAALPSPQSTSSAVQSTFSAIRTPVKLQSALTSTSLDNVTSIVTSVVTSILLQTSVLYQTSTLWETRNFMHDAVVLQTLVSDEASTVFQSSYDIETSFLDEASTIFQPSFDIQTSVVLETSTVLTTSTEVYTTVVAQTSVPNQPSTRLNSSLEVRTSVFYETSTVLTTETEVHASIVSQSSVITATEVHTTVVSETSVITSTEVYTAVVSEISVIISTEVHTEFISQTSLIISTQVEIETETITSIISETSLTSPTTAASSDTSPTASACPTYTPNPKPYAYQGCMSDLAEPRTLGGPEYQNDCMTTKQCAALCEDYSFFGTEYGTQCFCGTSSIGNATVLSGSGTQTECNYACSGDQGEFCGGNYWLSIYQFT